MSASARDLNEINEINAMFIHQDRWGDFFEEITLSLYSSVLGNGDVALDCGANHGDHTRAMARACGRDGKVFAFEAAPEMMQRAQNTSRGYENIIFIERALWNEPNIDMTFNYYPNEHGLSSLLPIEGVTARIPIEVTTTTLDESVNLPVSMIKLDIEGAEYHALRGATRIMTSDRPIIVFENSRQTAADKFGYSKEDFFSLFSNLGYNLYTVSGMPLVIEIWDNVMPWQFIAVHPASPRLPRVFAATQAFVYKLRSHIR